MALYHNFIGIDIGKDSFFVSIFGQEPVQEFENTDKGIKVFTKKHKKHLAKGFCVLETTGGYELNLLYRLCDEGHTVHRADTRKVKRFIQSYGTSAKTDRLDAKALAQYGLERYESLTPYKPLSKQSLALYQLVQRRMDLKQMLVAEKNRKQSPENQFLIESCETIIKVLEKEERTIIDTIESIIAKDPKFCERRKVLRSVPGIGEILSFELLVLLPELGKLDRKKIAALSGLAPVAKESGKYKGYRRTNHGRAAVKPKLFLAAMAARNSKSDLKRFYDSLIGRGKKKMVALIAVARKIIVIANARLKELDEAMVNNESLAA